MKEAIFFYDGDCGFCNTTVIFLLKRTKLTTLLFCPLQSQYADSFFAKHGYRQPDLTTAYLFYRGRLYQKSSAVLKAVTLAEGIVKYIGICSLAVPRFIRDAGYDFVASIRQSIKLGKNSCRMLTAEERQRFLSF